MNILASFDWLKEYVNKTPSPAEFVRRMTEVGNSVEQVIDVGATLERVVVGKILEVKAHPNADKLRVVDVLIYSILPKGEVGRGSVEIVCGGSNLEFGHLVAVALPGAKVKWHGGGEFVEIKETELRGVKSFGMICAPGELGFEKLQQEDRMIWDLTELTDAKPGTSLASALGLDDLLFDIEVTTNRPDAMSIIGLAREAGAAGLGKFEIRNLKFETKMKSEIRKSKIDVRVEATDLCPRYQAVMIENVKVAPSPWWMQKRLLLSGHRPINNVVDVTNYILHEMGQPLHAFDADKLEGGKIIVRKAKKGEKILALDGKEYELDPSMLAICDAARPVAVAGVMGGEPTGTTESTTHLVIESATFDPVSVRRTSRALNLYSDSSSLFEKGLSTESTAPALRRAIELICELTGGNVASSIVDERAGKYKPRVFAYDPRRVSDLIGVDVPAKKQRQILEAFGFVIGKGKITVPYWRDHDIENSVDFVEEVARVVGYDHLPSVLPTGTVPTPMIEPIIPWERKVKVALKGAGATESSSISLVSEDQLRKMEISLTEAVKIQNPLSEDWAFLRPSLWPTMLSAVEFNRHQFPEATLFELSAVHEPRQGEIPASQQRLMIAGYAADGEEAFRRVKGVLERLLREVGVNEVFINTDSDSAKDNRFHPGRVAALFVGKKPGPAVGMIGEIHPRFAKAFGIDGRLTLADIDFDRLLSRLGAPRAYQASPEFPETVRDISFLVDASVEYRSLEAKIHQADSLIDQVVFLDCYQGKGIDQGKKSLAFRLSLRAADRTLSSDEADAVMKKVSDVLSKEFGAIIR